MSKVYVAICEGTPNDYGTSVQCLGIFTHEERAKEVCNHFIEQVVSDYKNYRNKTDVIDEYDRENLAFVSEVELDVLYPAVIDNADDMECPPSWMSGRVPDPIYTTGICFGGYSE